MRWKRLCVLTGLSVCSFGRLPVAHAQDGATLEQERKLYQDALAQSKAAQDRKNELATENAKLNARIADLEKQAEDARHKAAGEAERTYLLRARAAAWNTFLKQNPETAERWRDWLSFDIRPGGAWQLGDIDWPWGGGVSP